MQKGWGKSKCRQTIEKLDTEVVRETGIKNDFYVSDLHMWEDDVAIDCKRKH